jgi:hypothetical protein
MMKKSDRLARLQLLLIKRDKDGQTDNILIEKLYYLKSNKFHLKKINF